MNKLKSEMLDATVHQNDRWLSRPLAIVGMACRLPGADDLNSFWELLRSGGYAIERMPDSKLDRGLYFDENKGVRGKTYSDIGGFVRQRDWDWSILPLDPNEASVWDECHLNLCEVAAQACVHAGYDPHDLPIRNASVFVGHSGGTTLGGELAYRTLACDYIQLLDEVADWQLLDDADAARGELLSRLQAGRPRRRDGRPLVDASYAAALISRVLGLTGPHMSIDAACASSLVALALGANSLQSGHSELAIVGGASFNKADSLILFSHAQSCSSEASRPFDQRADGLISSEGYVTILLKTLERAEADGDSIQAVIRGIGMASDGRGRSLWAPRKEGQCEAIRRAYCDDVRPESVQLIEAHATSTQVGDATEMEALAAFYGKCLPSGTRLPVGSVKSNIGHTLETAGLAGLVKTILAMQHQTIPPSVNVEQLSDSIPWEDIPLYVARDLEPWPRPKAGAGRRAAVNAFGIGGLNVHVVVDDYVAPASLHQRTTRSTQSLPKLVASPVVHSFEPVAIVGRGLVLPGVRGIEAFTEFLKDPTSQLSFPTPERARFRDENWMECGYISGFQYDWRKHKVPPKQIAQANPLQFMLLDAAEQAFQEAGLLRPDFDRQHTAVVVGSPFGGDFGNALYAGLRLPELKEQMESVIRAHGATAKQFQELWREYETVFLREYPALLDETGSFTSSTLASRLAKTFDLMGGAMAVDAGDCSGLAALYAGCQLLQSGAANQVLCAAAHRALDRAGIENLRQQGLLASAATPSAGSVPGTRGNARPEDANRAVGEGVALVLLRRSADAEKAGDRCYATLTDITCGFDATSVSQSVKLAARRHQSMSHTHVATYAATGIPGIDQAIAAGLRLQETGGPGDPSNPYQGPAVPRNLPTMGHLQAVQSLVDIIAASCDPAPRVSRVASWAPTGQSYLASIGANRLASRIAPTAGNISRGDRSSIQPYSIPKLTTKSDTLPMQTFRFESQTADGLAALLNDVQSSPVDEIGSPSVASFRSDEGWRAAIVCPASELREKASRLAAQIKSPQALQAMAEQAMFCSPPDSRVSQPKIAWLFPGQGSQYSNMLKDLIEVDTFAAERLREADRILAKMNQPSFEELAWRPENQLGEDVWYTQAAMLVTDWIMSSTLINRGFSPALVTGHSFGEFAALLAAGCWDLSSALAATWHRCQSIGNYTSPGCAMLSIQANRSTAQQLINDAEVPLAVSHVNAPQQTVVGGRQAAIARFAQILEEEGISSRILPVPTAFHTPSLEAAVEPFRAALKSIAMDPPRIRMLSSITNAYATDPNHIRQALADQLVQTADFVGLVKRLLLDGVTLAVEVGPQQVLSKLIRQNTDQLTVIATDHPKRGCAAQMLCAQAVMELHQPITEASTLPRTSSLAEGDGRRRAYRPAPVHFDATQNRRNRVRMAAVQSATQQPRLARDPSSQMAVHFDATNSRRQSRRALAVPLANSAGPSSQPSHPLPKLPAKSSPIADHVANDGSDAPLNPAESEVAQRSEAALGSEAIEKFLIDFVVEQTGYPAEIIELDWDIEADLGIDSIKKAQLFGELREFFELEVHQGLSLDKFVSLRDIVNLLEQTPGKGTWLGADNAEQDRPPVDGRDHDTSVSSDSFAAADHHARMNQADPTTGADEPTGHSLEELTSFLVDFVVEQTGYPPEIVELDADLEADLGIDSIKKAQLLGELREMFSLKLDSEAAKGDERRNMTADLGTLRQILDFLMASQSRSTERRHATEAKTAAGELLRTASPAATAQTEDTAQTEGAGHKTAASRPGLVADSESLPKQEFVESSNALLGSPDKRPSLPVAEPARRELLTGEPSAGELPTAPLPKWNTELGGSQIANGQPLANQRFAKAAQQNIMAMAAVPENGNSPHNFAVLKGLAPWYEDAIRELSVACEISQQSIRAFDGILQTHVDWKPVSNQTVPNPAASPNWDHPGGQQNVFWLLELDVPAWLASSSGELLGIRQSARREGMSEALIVPGAIVPMACIRPDGILLAAGIKDNEQSAFDARLQLAQFLDSIPARTLAEVADAVRSIRLPVDWWLLAVEAKTANRLMVSCDNDQLVIEKDRLDHSGTTESANAEKASARIGLDTKAGFYTIDVQSKPYPIARARFEWRCGDALNGATKDLGRNNDLDAAMDTALGSKQSPLPSGFPAQSDWAGQQDSRSQTSAQNGIASRYVMRMSPSPARSAPGRQPAWCGAAVVVGDNPVARQLCARLRSAGVDTFPLAGTEDPYYLSNEFVRLAKECVIPHLFIATPWDSDAAATLDPQAWNSRRNKGLLGNFWLCQKWLAHVVAAGLADEASLVAVTSLGGDFGISGHIYSAEGGGLAGLLKSMMIESWTQGIRPLPIKILDCPSTQSPAEIVSNIWQELAVPSYDFEVSYLGSLRNVVRAIPRPVPEMTKPITRGGTWVCTGGARGITAFVAEQLATRYDLKLHLVGMSPSPDIEPGWRDLDDAGLRALKAKIMTAARGAGRNPVKTWQDTEKALEIDLTLRKLRQAGIELHYHSCDISDRDALASVMREVHRLSGPVHGVLHGAGFGKDSRFDRKQPEKVQQCIAAKVDGALAIMDATRDDPLEYFVGFGSISGRFGANGHTDYSLANEMLCKLIAWYSKQRPEVKAVGFHWHAWGDVGMATKPETRLALEMIDMQFMPAREGLSHLIAELESDAQEREILITDDRYYRMFFPAETLVSTAKPVRGASGPTTPLIEGEVRPMCGGERAFSIIVNPTRDPFLAEHLLDGKPLLPFVIASEMLLEAASQALETSHLHLGDMEATGALRFFMERTAELRVETNRRTDRDTECRLYSDFFARDGRLVEPNRCHFRATASIAERALGKTIVELPSGTHWQRASYPSVDAKFYAGWPLQRLRKVAIVDRGLVGEICAPALIELAGSDRRVQGWRIPSAAMDACLFATGILAWQQVAPGTALPVRIHGLSVGRLPDPGEACRVHVRLNEMAEDLPADRASFDFTLYGVDGDLILDATGYEVAWIGGAPQHKRQELPSSTLVERQHDSEIG